MTANNDDLVAELERRVREKKALGLYTIDILAVDSVASETPFDAAGLARLAELVEVTPHPELARSTKPGLGGIVGRIKFALSRATSQPLAGVADETTQFHAALIPHLSLLAQEVERLRRRVSELEELESSRARRDS